MIRNLAQICSSEVCSLSTFIRKNLSVSIAAGAWVDLSMSPGFPIPNYYASTPLEARDMAYSKQKGINHGQSYNEKYLFDSLLLATGTTQMQNVTYILCDYLLYYPFLDEGSMEEQIMGNSSSSLTRYVSGDGVQLMAISQGTRVGGQTFQVKYTNQAGVSGRVTPLIYGNNISITNGTVMSSSGGLSVQGSLPFLPLQSGDTGVRSVESFQMISGVDTGIFALVLVRPIATMTYGEGGSISFRNHIMESGMFTQKIQNDAYLNMICSSSGAFAGQTMIGMLNFLVK